MHPRSPHAPARRRAPGDMDPLERLALELRAHGRATTGAHAAAEALVARRQPGARRAAFRSPPIAR